MKYQYQIGEYDKQICDLMPEEITVISIPIENDDYYNIVVAKNIGAYYYIAQYAEENDPELEDVLGEDYETMDEYLTMCLLNNLEHDPATHLKFDPNRILAFVNTNQLKEITNESVDRFLKKHAWRERSGDITTEKITIM